MSHRVCVIDLPAFGREMVEWVPAGSALGTWIAASRVHPLTPCTPALTSPAQATLTTGKLPSQHGIVANGVAAYRNADDANLTDPANYADYRRQVSFWEQSNQFLQSPRFWQNADGSSKYKTALLFFQHCMPGFSGSPRPAADVVLTPKPDHGPDGKLTSLLWSNPAGLVPKLFAEFGPFPLMNYWGPLAGIVSSAWIAKAAAWVWQYEQPQLQLTYVPHLDYDLQRFGPASPQARKAVEDVATALEPLLDAVLSSGGKIILLSEYAMKSAARSLAPNRLLHDAGLLKTRAAADGALIDYASSDAFAMADHQVAHVYTSRPEAAAAALKADGVGIVPRSELASLGLDHRRAGNLVLLSEPDAGVWFEYRWWSDAADEPAFARDIDIHRKPGYDPLELFMDFKTRKLFRDAALVKGTHGSVTPGEAVLIAPPGLELHGYATLADVPRVVETAIR